MTKNTTTSVPKKEAVTPSEAITNTAQKGGGKTGIIIIIVVLVLCVICGGLLVGGYLFFKKVGKSTEDGFQGGFIDMIEEGVEEKIEEEIGENSDFSFGGELPSSFPTDVPVYPNSEVGVSSSTNNESGKSIYISLSTTDSPGEVVSFYKEEIVKEGWSITSETEFLGFSILAKKGERDLTIYIYDGEDGTTYYTITING
ncbi:hypothetical protein JW796_04270 [Candidatus Dojkabacteria bacterium]|nr:hypothetical protein [Candidatus Dojkabacteria bacterium]